MLLQGKKALILGLANNRSIAYGIAAALKAQGARLAFNYVGDAIKKRVEPLSEELGGEFTFQCDVCDGAIWTFWCIPWLLPTGKTSAAALWTPRVTVSSLRSKFRPIPLPRFAVLLNRS